jgi:glycine betaine/proline transport system permease protein
MELPLGETFEVIVRGLKDNLGGFFEATRDTIDFAITLLERILSLDPSVWYSSVTVILIFGALVYLLSRRKFAFRQSLVIGGASILLLGAMDTWRSNVINETVDTGEAKVVSRQLADYRQSLSLSGVASLSEEGVRTVDRILSRFETLDTSRTKVSLLGERTYERYRELLSEVKEQASPDLRTESAAIHKLIKQYNPNRMSWYSWLVVSTLMTLLAWICASPGLAVFSFLGLSLIMNMGFWSYTTDTLALVMSATGFALLLGVPLGIAAAANKTVDQILKPILDFMQTMPAFVYLIPAVLLFGLGKVPGAMATLIFAMPPAVRLTSLGIRSVPTEVVEAAQSFGSTPMQLLFKAQLPIALPTILAGLNQTIMLALSMVVIGGMIGAGGLGEVVLSGITQLKIGLGFESGLSVVILAIYLDRLTQALGNYQSNSKTT